MARKKVEVINCDVCGDAGARPWRLQPPSSKKQVEVDLCDKHAEPLDSLAGQGRPAPLPRSERFHPAKRMPAEPPPKDV